MEKYENIVSADKFGIAPLWNELINIYCVIEKIMLRHHLHYWVSQGSMIGAVKYKGFIPWDDDFDIGMPRKDYEEFIRIAQHELPDGYKLVTWRNTPEFAPALYAKVVEVRPEVLQRVEEDGNRMLPQGIYVDIFPKDGVPESKVARFSVRFIGKLLTCMILSYNGYQKSSLSSIVARTIGVALRACCLFLPTRQSLTEHLEGLSRRLDFDGSKYVAHGFCMFANDTFPSSAVKEMIPMPFERLMVPIPVGYDEYLRARYGDYTKTPPASLQHPTHGSNIQAAWKYGPTEQGRA